jgi:SAM-dependent methyltransferase
MSQAQHYDSIVDDYERHYVDGTSLDYRRRYLYSQLFDGLDLNSKRVIELACGSGYNTLEMLRRFPLADAFGVDISPKSCEAFRRTTGREGFELDLTDRSAPLPPPADIAFVIGGLHHCHNDLSAAFDTISRLLKSGGLLLMVEPNAQFFLNQARRRWYATDKWFRDEEEAAIDYGDLLKTAGTNFGELSVRYFGGPAYFLILNSLVTRVPLRLKPLIAPPLFVCDDVYNLLPGSMPFPAFFAKWVMRGSQSVVES